MSRVLTRSQLGRVTHWVRTQHHQQRHPSSSSVGSARWVPFSTANVGPFSRNKIELPEEVVHLKCSSSAKSGVCNVYLVGVVHQSQKSCEEVRSVVRLLKPPIVFLELCTSRRGFLTTKSQKDASKHKAIPYYEMPGAEFKVAYEEARKYGGKVACGDRPVRITQLRALRKMRLLETIRLFSFHFRKDGSRLHEVLKLIHGNMNMDMVTQYTQELSTVFPTHVETVVHERDLFMSVTLSEVAKRNSCVVAVVGKGHIEGIKKHWKQPVSVQVFQDLLTVPPRRHTAAILTSVGLGMVGAAMVWRYL